MERGGEEKAATPLQMGSLLLRQAASSSHTLAGCTWAGCATIHFCTLSLSGFYLPCGCWCSSVAPTHTCGIPLLHTPSATTCHPTLPTLPATLLPFPGGGPSVPPFPALLPQFCLLPPPSLPACPTCLPHDPYLPDLYLPSLPPPPFFFPLYFVMGGLPLHMPCSHPAYLPTVASSTIYRDMVVSSLPSPTPLLSPATLPTLHVVPFPYLPGV